MCHVWRSKDNFCHVGIGHMTQVVRLGNKPFYPPSHLASHPPCFLDRDFHWSGAHQLGWAACPVSSRILLSPTAQSWAYNQSHGTTPHVFTWDLGIELKSSGLDNSALLAEVSPRLSSVSVIQKIPVSNPHPLSSDCLLPEHAVPAHDIACVLL